MAVARSLKARRVGVGALELESAEIRVKFDQHHKTVADLVAKVTSPVSFSFLFY